MSKAKKRRVRKAPVIAVTAYQCPHCRSVRHGKLVAELCEEFCRKELHTARFVEGDIVSTVVTIRGVPRLIRARVLRVFIHINHNGTRKVSYKFWELKTRRISWGDDGGGR